MKRKQQGGAEKYKGDYEGQTVFLWWKNDSDPSAVVVLHAAKVLVLLGWSLYH